MLGVVVNDATRFYRVIRTSSTASNAAMNASTDRVREQPNVSAEALAAEAAAANGATLESYAQENASMGGNLQVRVTLTVGVPVKKTIIVGPVIGLVKHVPAGEWFSPSGVTFTLRSSKLVTQFGLAP